MVAVGLRGCGGGLGRIVCGDGREFSQLSQKKEAK